MIKKMSFGNYGDIVFSGYPDECPNCHKAIVPRWHSQINIQQLFVKFYATLLCPNSDCEFCFVAEYLFHGEGDFRFTRILKPKLKELEFNSMIPEISESFTRIYNQAFSSEQLGLAEISGVGYRKALEFLIKDYLIYLNPEKTEVIKRLFLGNCIKDHISNEQIKSVAKRAVWLGNDETHYVRKWEDKDLSDLKILIELTTRWIEMEELTKKLEIDMPE